MPRRIEGLVLDVDWSEPLRDITVYAQSTDGFQEGSAVTDSNGRFLIINLSNRTWVAKLAGGTAGNIILVPTETSVPDHGQLGGVETDQHHALDHFTRHQTLGDDPLALEALAGTIIGPGHGDQTGEVQALHTLSEMLGSVTDGQVPATHAGSAHHAAAHTFDSHSDVPAITEAQGQVIYWNGTNWVALAPGTSGQFLKTQGVGANPMWDTAAGGAALTVQEEDGTPIDTAVTIIRVPNGGLTDNGAGDVSLGYAIAGAAPTAHTFDSHSDVPAITEAQGQVIYWNGTNWVALGPGTSGQFLKTQGSGANPMWADSPGNKRQIVLRLDDTQVGASTGYKEEFLPARSIAPADFTALDDWANHVVSDTQEVFWTWRVPPDFVSFTNINVVMIPDTTETLQFDIDTSIAAAAEDYNLTTAQSLNQTVAVTISDLTEWDIKGIGTLFSGVAANDYIAIRLQGDTASSRIAGLHIKYDSGTGSTTKAALVWRNTLSGTFKAIADAEASVGVTQTFTVYKNGVSTGTVTIAAGGRVGTLSAWSIALAWGDLVQVDHTSGNNSGTRHLVTLVEV